VKEFWNPVGDSAHREGEHGKSECAAEEGGVAEKTENCGAICGHANVVLRAALRFAAVDAVEDGDEQSGNSADEERLAPPPRGSHLAAGEVAESGADGDCDVEDGEDSVSVALWIEISDDGRREDRERGLANANNRVAEVERPVIVNPCSGESGKAPEYGTTDDERLSAEAVAKPAGERSGQHVDEEHRRGERAHLLARGVKFILDEREFAGKDVSVDEVEKVEGDEKDQCGECGTDARMDG